MTKFIGIEVKSILQKYKFRDDWFWNRCGANPYRGCQFACNYTDLYQPAEKKYELTRKTLEILAEHILIGAAITLRSNQRIRFFELLKTNFPELVEKYKNLYREKENPPQDYIVRLNGLAFGFCKKYGIM